MAQIDGEPFQTKAQHGVGKNEKQLYKLNQKLI